MNWKVYSISLFVLLFSVACNSTEQDDKVLSVTIEPQKYLLEKIVGDQYSVNCVVSGNANPESFDMTPSQVATISKSKAYFKTGLLGIENSWIDNLINTNPEIKLVDCSRNIISLGNHEYCEHDHHHHGHIGADPHIWSSPATVKIMAENMYHALLDIDSEKEEYYTENFKKLMVEINQIDSIVRAYIDKAPSKSFIIYHPSLSYFAEQYGLNQYTIERDGKNPSPVQLKELIDTSIKEGVKAVFVQVEYDQKNTETIVNAIGGKAYPINLMAYNWSDEMIKVAKALAE